MPTWSISLSKYINGHGDAVAGAVLGSRALIERVREFAVTRLGGCISPFNAWQIMRGSATLPLRLERHSDNALAVAEFLESHPKVAWVRFPGLPSHPQHEVARAQMKYYSGMLNFDIVGDPGQRIEVIRRLKFFSHATCLGHDESLARAPWPEANPDHLVEDTVTLVVQVNGKRRDEVQVPATADSETIQAAALALEKVQKHLGGREPRKVIVVPGRLVNVVG